ncbi:helix-turn-helix protein [Micromonospora pisi]|uniref:Helix-turn-helix protein n=1 Tax=Micromonospora pisi TaxID=589240 RepID=A0A495JS76_9ACTN|nr:helix-turn-helix transcriptional regulator [Micromonospora pisi]RKR91214.1 helix-turn-helix protein [Micromonospora pisi]
MGARNHVARQERPVDPTAGPLQEFAYELRKLRAEAGNPTYRVLARSAGYSATTLSEAAGGTRLPTLEVVLAYVGACHGDPAAWQRRWSDTAARTAPTGEAATRQDAGAAAIVDAPATGPPHIAEPPPTADAAATGRAGAIRRGAARWRWRRTTVGAVGAVTALVAAVMTVLAATSPPPDEIKPHPPASAAPNCPGVPPDAAFTGVTYGGGAHVRRGASRDDALVTTIPPHCTVGFTGFCVGEKVYDNTGGTPDVRWFKTADGGVVSSAVIHGNPPRTQSASDCPNGRPAPTAVRFAVTAADGVINLHASGTDLDIVGFTASTGAASTDAGPTDAGPTDAASTDTGPADAGPAARQPGAWRQLALADVRHPADGARVRFDAPGAAHEPVILVAAACLGGDSPTGVVEARRVHPAYPGESVAVTLAPEQRGAAASSACRYPNRG